MADIVYDIQFTVDRVTPKVTPTAPQKAGYYGDDNAARLTFSGVDDSFDYQIEIVDGNGAYDITETLTTDGAGNLVYEVPSAWTAAGLASVRLVEIGEESVMHYPEVQLLFEARDTGEQMGDMLPRWQSVMRDSEAATQDAIEAAEYATQAGEFAASQTPNIQNGEWYLGDQNTGVQAVGEQGPQGPKGDNGVVDYTKTANALKGKVEGNPIAIKDSSPFTQEVALIMNLFPREEISYDYFSSKKSDGGLVLNGTIEATNNIVLGSVSLNAGVYSLSLNNPVAMDSAQLVIVNDNWGFSLYLNEPYRKNDTLSIPQGEYEVRLHAGSGNAVFKNFAFNPQLVKSGATVTKYGKNLLDLSQVTTWNRCKYDAETGVVTSNIDTAYTRSYFSTKQLNDVFVACAGKTFTFCVGKGHEAYGTEIVVYGANNSVLLNVGSGSKKNVLTFTVPSNVTEVTTVTFRFNIGASREDTKTVFSDFQLEVGDTATDYEPYVEPTDLTENSITMKGEGVTLFANNGETLTAEYSRDINKAFAELWKKVMEG